MTDQTFTPSPFRLNPRRGHFYNIQDIMSGMRPELSADDTAILERIDLIYRTLCGIMYNFVPTSGHPGGSISSGRFVQGLIYNAMDYNFQDPEDESADIIVYAAGHKAMGLYAMWALRNELVRVGSPKVNRNDLLAPGKRQVRLEDLLGFRRNPTNDTPLFLKHHARPLDGHPTCATPFVKIATGASGVGVPAALGLALGAIDTYGGNAPNVHMVEGEGGMTPGRVHEALATAATARLRNAFLHVDWNQASIDSNRVCRENDQPGDYVQWNPVELCYFHDWNVVFVPEGHDFNEIAAAQKFALTLDTGQPTAVVYRTVKGWKYGVQGRDSHGAGHKFCSDGYYASLAEFESAFKVQFPRLPKDSPADPATVEQLYYDTLMIVRGAIGQNARIPEWAAGKIAASKDRLAKRDRSRRADAPSIEALYTRTDINVKTTPEELVLKPGSAVTLREALGKTLGYLNTVTKGAFLVSSADLLGSTSVNLINKGFPEGFYNAADNPHSRLVPIGGICEDAMGAVMAGVSSFGRHVGVTSSYGAFLAALEHVAARLHGIGQQTREAELGLPYNPWIMVNAHAGVKTGEDGPTHADPQALQLLQECFPNRVMITLTPWDAQEVWPMMVAALRHRPAIIAPFVTRPADKVVDRAALRFPPVHKAAEGIYALRTADVDSKQYNGTVVLQGNGVASTFVAEVLPELEKRGLNLNVFYVTSVELFKLLPRAERESILPEEVTYEAIGITDFTLPTLHQWVRSNEGLRRSLHSFRGGHYLGSGSAAKVLEEAGIHGKGQLDTILKYAADVEKGKFEVRLPRRLSGHGI
jgi:transketolase